MKLTPTCIEFLMYSHYNVEPHPRIKSQSFVEAKNILLNVGLVEGSKTCKDTYQTTPRGAAFVTMLCQTPLPIQVWLNPLDNKVVDERGVDQT